MSIDFLLILIFYGLLLLFFFYKRERFEVQGRIFAIYKTKLGLKLMDKIAKSFPRFLRVLGYLSILTGLAGMGFILYILIKGTYTLLLVPGAVPVLAPVLPGVKIAGLPVLSFWYWVISI